MPNDDERTYTVGFRKPPAHTRFKPGQSGNPKGRPPNSKNMMTLLNEALDESVVIQENGRRRRITKRRATMKQLANKGTSGDLKSIQLLLTTLRDHQPVAGSPEADSELFDDADEQVIQNIMQRFNQRGNDDGSESK